MSPEDRIIARMRQLQAQGRAPELTANDAAVALGVTAREAKLIMAQMARDGIVSGTRLRNGPPTIYRLAHA